METTKREYLAQVKQTMRERKISGADIARDLGKSTSRVNSILRGEYPYCGAYGWPDYLDDYFTQSLGLHHFPS